MKTKKSFLAVVLGFMIMVPAGIFAYGPAKGSVAPDFTLKMSDGSTTTLSSLQGKAVLLHFWATWCPPCRRELPGMNELAKKISSQGKSGKLQFVAVCVSDTEKNRASFMDENDYTFPGGLDSTGKIASLYGVQGIPTSVLISPSGKILNIAVGAMSESQLANFVSDYAD
ncbi:MAG: TlpA family protein disulfide reductase [Treponema sp.]|jgi:peroxiredoxin|nr:TlpA family protein disulfide reductase [Treponema sp.]